MCKQIICKTRIWKYQSRQSQSQLFVTMWGRGVLLTLKEIPFPYIFTLYLDCCPLPGLQLAQSQLLCFSSARVSPPAPVIPQLDTSSLCRARFIFSHWGQTSKIFIVWIARNRQHKVPLRTTPWRWKKRGCGQEPLFCLMREEMGRPGSMFSTDSWNNFVRLPGTP